MNDRLFSILNDMPSFELKASAALERATQTPNGFFPPLTPFERGEILELVTGVKDYTDRCWKATQRLEDLPASPIPVEMLEFGL